MKLVHRFVQIFCILTDFLSPCPISYWDREVFKSWLWLWICLFLLVVSSVCFMYFEAPVIRSLTFRILMSYWLIDLFINMKWSLFLAFFLAFEYVFKFFFLSVCIFDVFFKHLRWNFWITWFKYFKDS